MINWIFLPHFIFPPFLVYLEAVFDNTKAVSPGDGGWLEGGNARAAEYSLRILIILGDFRGKAGGMDCLWARDASRTDAFVGGNCRMHYRPVRPLRSGLRIRKKECRGHRDARPPRNIFPPSPFSRDSSPHETGE